MVPALIIKIWMLSHYAVQRFTLGLYCILRPFDIKVKVWKLIIRDKQELKVHQLSWGSVYPSLLNYIFGIFLFFLNYFFPHSWQSITHNNTRNKDTTSFNTISFKLCCILAPLILLQSWVHCTTGIKHIQTIKATNMSYIFLILLLSV